ncbi:MAG TPA: glycosyltransferase, partial [Bryobacteraceae bacterium]|nr:glycosyltransferase [Bryobacteraceae bacterium]
MGPRPKISIILAFLNPGEDFKLAIQSVFAQTFTDWELILMDDGSTDGSLEYAQSIDDRRVRVVSDGTQRNLNYRLNQMIDLARGEYIARMDADDVMHPERLAKQHAELQRHSNDTVVGTAAWSLDVANHVVGLRPMRNVQRHGFAATASFMHPTVAASTEWFRRYRYSESFIFHRSQDAELWFRSSPESRFVTIEEPLLFYREVGNFSFNKYVGTQLGLVVLADRLGSTDRLGGLRALTLALAKLWITGVASALGKNQMIVRRRYQPMTRESIDVAEALLRRIQAVSIPVRVGSL